MRAAIYARVSTEEQNADNQVVVCREYCERNGHEVFKVYQDNAVSGMKTSRPAFDEMLRDMRQYKFQCIVVVRLDRIGRSLQHLISMFEEFKIKGVNFISVSQDIDTTSAVGKLQLHLIGAFAEYERNIISERTKEGLREKKNVGKRGKDKHPRKRRDGLRKKLEM